jgi:predicted dinucleotide-binding enzyme
MGTLVSAAPYGAAQEDSAMSGARKLSKTVVDTTVPMAGPAKMLTVDTRASSERSKASLAEFRCGLTSAAGG